MYWEWPTKENKKCHRKGRKWSYVCAQEKPKGCFYM